MGTILLVGGVIGLAYLMLRKKGRA
jgi:hypothetical protein